MKIAYLGKIQLSDVDLSYLHEAQKLSDITYILEITPRFQKGPAFNIKKIVNKVGIFKATDLYPELSKYANYIDTDKFFVANTYGRFWQIKAFWTNFLLLIFIIRNKFNVIHIVWPLNIYEFILYYLKRRMILTVHDPFPHSGLDTFIVRLRRKFAFKFISRLIILNKAQRQQFIDYYNLKKHDAIDSQLSCYSYLNTIKTDNSFLSNNNRYILFAGNISKYKGLDYLLPAMVKVHNAFPDVKLIIAGRGYFHFDVSKYKELNYIEFRTYFIPEEELVSLIKNALFIICPYTDATQSGVIMSAFAFNKPVVATNVGGLPEMLGYGRYGILVKKKEIESLTEGIVKLLSDEDLLIKFSEHIKCDFGTGNNSWKVIASKIRNDYSKI